MAQVQAAGIAIFAVTDHDTVAALPEVARLASDAGVTFVPGIEITAVDRGKDVHVLGYFVDASCPALLNALEASRLDRLRRGRRMCEKLTAAGAPMDFDALFGDDRLVQSSGPVISRPLVADALVRAGHVATRQEAFDRYLAEGQPGYVPRIGLSPVEVVGLIQSAGGLAALAHPGVIGRDDLIGPLADHGPRCARVFSQRSRTGRHRHLPGAGVTIWARRHRRIRFSRSRHQTLRVFRPHRSAARTLRGIRGAPWRPARMTWDPSVMCGVVVPQGLVCGSSSGPAPTSPSRAPGWW